MYALAKNLVGFRSSTLRVKVLKQHSADQVSIITADLLDAGTRLTLDASQLEAIEDEAVSSVRHRTGLVEFQVCGREASYLESL